MHHKNFKTLSPTQQNVQTVSDGNISLNQDELDELSLSQKEVMIVESSENEALGISYDPIH